VISSVAPLALLLLVAPAPAAPTDSSAAAPVPEASPVPPTIDPEPSVRTPDPVRAPDPLPAVPGAGSGRRGMRVAGQRDRLRPQRLLEGLVPLRQRQRQQPSAVVDRAA